MKTTNERPHDDKRRKDSRMREEGSQWGNLPSRKPKSPLIRLKRLWTRFVKTLVPALRAENMAAKKERKMSKMEAKREEIDEVTDDILRI